MKAVLYAIAGWLMVLVAGIFLLGAIADEHHLRYAVIMVLFATAALWFFQRSKGQKKKPATFTPAEVLAAARRTQAQGKAEAPAGTDVKAATRSEEKEKSSAAAQRARQLEDRAARFSEILDSIPAAAVIADETPAKHHDLEDLEPFTFSNITAKTPRDKLGNFVTVDVETTGLSAGRAEIVEIAAVRFRGFAPVEKFCSLCAPRKGIDPSAAAINGITADMVEGKPRFDQIAGSLQAFIDKDNIVGQNLEFDLRFLWKGGLDFLAEKRRYYDTIEIAKRTLKKARYKYDKEYGVRELDYDKEYDVEDYKLGTLCAYYGIDYFGSHRALADAYVTGKLLEKLAEDRE